MGYDQICTFSFETGWMANTCNSKFPHQRQCKLVNITEKTWWDLGFIHVQFDGRGKEEEKKTSEKKKEGINMHMICHMYSVSHSSHTNSTATTTKKSCTALTYKEEKKIFSHSSHYLVNLI